MNDSPSMTPRRDWFFHVICGMIACVVLWLILTPIVPAVAESTMRRFHLCSRSFWWFAVQQPVPSMYNFANEFQPSAVPFALDESTDIFSVSGEKGPRRFVNHYPFAK